MNTSIKWSCLILSILPCLSSAASPGPYGDLGIGVSSGPSSVTAPSSRFIGSGGTLTGGVTDLYGFNTLGVFGAYAALGYNFQSNFGLEANYNYWGQQKLSNFTGQQTTATGMMNGNLSSNSFGGSLVGYLPMENNLVNFYAKLGLAGLLTSLKINDPQNTVFLIQDLTHNLAPI